VGHFADISFDRGSSFLLRTYNVKAIPAGGQLTLVFPRSGEYHVSVDEFAGVGHGHGKVGPSVFMQAATPVV